MWDRKELKYKGKAAYRANRITCIIAALLLTIATGAGFGGASAGSGVSSIQRNINNNDITNEYSDDLFDDDLDDMYDYYQDPDELFDEHSEDILEHYLDDLDDPGDIGEVPDTYGYTQTAVVNDPIPPVAVFIIVIAVLIAAVIGAAIGIFLLNPLQVGLRKFFIDNASDHTTGLNKNNVGIAFSGTNYMNIVGSMFTTGLFTFLWALLLIIPGVYKSYCWRLVPYIVSENPGISGTEARAMSNEMMRGSKWAAFVLDLSFLGWLLLGALTLGILNLVFTNPYVAATDAELYLTLSGRPSEIAYADQAAPQKSSEVIVEFDQDEITE